MFYWDTEHQQELLKQTADFFSVHENAENDWKQKLVSFFLTDPVI